MKKRWMGPLAVMAMVLGGILSGAAPAQAATGMQITRVYYNSPGADTGSNTSLNAEYVMLTNKASWRMNLKYYTLKDRSGYTYRFSTDFIISPGASVVIHTGKGTNTSTHRYWGRTWYVWNNTGDTAYLRNAAGTLVDSCTWGSTGSYTNC